MLGGGRFLLGGSTLEGFFGGALKGGATCYFLGYWDKFWGALGALVMGLGGRTCFLGFAGGFLIEVGGCGFTL